MSRFLLLFCVLLPLSAQAASSPILNYLIGTWQGDTDVWTFQGTQLTQTTSKKFSNGRGTFTCMVQWQGTAFLQVCSAKSRANGFCYNKGRVAKYIFTANWNVASLVADAANGRLCAVYVETLNQSKTVAHLFLSPMAMDGDNDIWLGGAHLVRENP